MAIYHNMDPQKIEGKATTAGCLDIAHLLIKGKL